MSQRRSGGPVPRRRANPPNDDYAAEKSVIGGILVHPSTFNEVANVLQAEDFSHPALRVIYEGMLELARTSKPIDALTVAEQMKATGTLDMLRAFNGPNFLTELMGEVVTVENIEYHARIVRTKATARLGCGVAADLSRALSDAHAPGDVTDLLAVYAGRLERLAERNATEPAKAPATAAAAARAEWSRPMPPAIPTGLAPLDELLGGGLREASTYVIAGATGRGKTGLAIQVARAVAPRLAVVYVSSELARRQILARAAAQALGAPWRDLLALEPGGAHVVANALEGLPLYVEELSRDEAITAAADRVAQALGQAPMLVLDYLQHAARRGSPADYRLAVATASDLVVRYARDTRSIALVVSSMARGSTSTEGAQTDARAAAAAPKESGDVEYDAAGVMLLDVGEREPDGTAPTRLVVGKSRYGVDGVVGLRFRGAVGVFETDASAALSELDAAVLEAVAGGASTVEAIRAACERRKQDVTSAVKRLARAGHIVPAGQHGGWRVR